MTQDSKIITLETHINKALPPTLSIISPKIGDAIAEIMYGRVYQSDA